jgi:RNA polymerase sigma-70 factor (ECF subfamily)
MAADAAQSPSEPAEGEQRTLNDLLPNVYDELRARASALLVHERSDPMISATALVHEAYLKLIDQRAVRWKGRAHLCAVAVRVMRRILIDHARARKCVKRRECCCASPNMNLMIVSEQTIDLATLDEALNRLAATHGSASRVVELRYLGGLTIKETAHALGLSESTVEREWRYARAWLCRILER